MLLALLLLLSLVSLCFGDAPLSLADVIGGLLGTGSEDQRLIVRQIRLPRVVLAWLVGCSLGASGAALQGLLRNPLAEPGLLGISSSASLGAVLTLYFGITTLSLWMLPAAAMLFALLATLTLYGLTRAGSTNLTLILAGVALASLAGALTSLALNLAPNPTDLQDIVLWLLGSISDRSFDGGAPLSALRARRASAPAAVRAGARRARPRRGRGQQSRGRPARGCADSSSWARP